MVEGRDRYRSVVDLCKCMSYAVQMKNVKWTLCNFLGVAFFVLISLIYHMLLVFSLYHYLDLCFTKKPFAPFKFKVIYARERYG